MPIFSRWWLNPTNPRQSDPTQLLKVGPLLQAEITIPAALAAHYQQNNIAIPAPQTGNALLDTGASITGVDANILTALGLNPVGTVDVLTPSGRQTQSLYPCQITFPGTPIPPVECTSVCGSSLAAQGLAVLVGRDVLCHFQMIYNGVEGIWTLSF